MRRVVAAIALAFLAAPASAADAKPNTLTPQEIADGWLLLFDGETTFGWTIDGEAKVENGLLILGGEKETIATTTSAYSSERLQFVYELTGEKNATAEWNAGRLNLVSLGKKTPLEIGGRGQARAPLTFRVPGGSHLRLQSVALRPEELKPIFNAKDLTGWHKVVTERTKSEFTVRDGELHIKSGPGDLETDQQWDDFVLQLDCRTNGKHLNSGVFFRCIPGLYLRGYEVQIHNDFTADPPREYTIQEFDPETHKLTGKKRVQSAAKDFGTGAVYNRVPARKQMAKDNEWFTMTVMAEGKHVAVWVNGVQVSDWTDNRPPHNNPRTGCRLEKGTISFQGHDPTTDLSFRNIRIAPLPKKP